MMERKRISRAVLIALFAALIAAGAFVRIPFVPVPITLQTLFALFAACCMPAPMGMLSVIVYLFLGAAGLPVFTSGGGLAAMLGPTGGYLIGMVPAVLAGSLVMRLFPEHPRLGALASSLSAEAITYAAGVLWLGWRMELGAMAALSAGFLPFIPGDIVKIIVTVSAVPAVQPRIKEMLERD